MSAAKVERVRCMAQVSEPPWHLWQRPCSRWANERVGELDLCYQHAETARALLDLTSQFQASEASESGDERGPAGSATPSSLHAQTGTSQSQPEMT